MRGKQEGRGKKNGNSPVGHGRLWNPVFPPHRGPAVPFLDNQYFTNRTIFCFCGNNSSDDGFTMRQDGALCAGRML